MVIENDEDGLTMSEVAPTPGWPQPTHRRKGRPGWNWIENSLKNQEASTTSNIISLEG